MEIEAIHLHLHPRVSLQMEMDAPPPSAEIGPLQERHLSKKANGVALGPKKTFSPMQASYV